MTIFEYDEEQHYKTLHDEGFEEGYNAAVAEIDREHKETLAEMDREHKEVLAEKDREITQKDEEIARLRKLLEDTQ